ncbi:hypothetical protein IMSAGC019_03762 [Lachnospiraceae bacterium]|nr:hypothetical protein IMSAGC019_03762 [Lachnospiraceae bacterium]
MMFHQFPEKGIVRVSHQVVKPDAGADKDLFYPWNLPEFPEQFQIILMACFHVFTGGGIKALFMGAYPVFFLFFTGGVAEIGGRAPHIVDIAFKIRFFGHFLRLCQN